ncbi:MAG: hypothetical protein E6Q40_10665 [Cupriavidus sp.]|nr:MAG: hypothetical protein E6Q40_10665 [Cupriavidus sp.]
MSIRALIAIATVALSLFAASCARAESAPIALPGDSKLVVFNYDANTTFTILTRPTSTTDIQLSDGEQLVVLALGDTARWLTSKADGHVFIKPTHPDLVTTGSLVTTLRTYQLNLRSSPENGKFYQRVSWEHPDLIALRQEQQQMAVRAAESARQTEQSRIDATVVSRGVDIEKLNFDFEVKGDAPFKPTQVFDDGKFTWIRLPKLQEMPLLFLKGPQGTELVNYSVKDQFLIVHRLAGELVLKLAEQEVTLRNLKQAPKNFWGF